MYRSAYRFDHVVNVEVAEELMQGRSGVAEVIFGHDEHVGPAGAETANVATGKQFGEKDKLVGNIAGVHGEAGEISFLHGVHTAGKSGHEGEELIEFLANGFGALVELLSNCFDDERGLCVLSPGGGFASGGVVGNDLPELICASAGALGEVLIHGRPTFLLRPLADDDCCALQVGAAFASASARLKRPHAPPCALLSRRKRSSGLRHALRSRGCRM